MVAPYGLHYLHMGELEGVSFQPQSLNIEHLDRLLPCRQIQ